MDLFYLGGTGCQYLEVDYAPSVRSNCWKCRKRIEKDVLRICACTDDQNQIKKKYYHLLCYKLKTKYRNMDPNQQVYGLDNLQNNDIDKVIKTLKKEIKRIKDSQIRRKRRQIKKAMQNKQMKKKRNKDQNQQDQQKTKVKRLRRPQFRLTKRNQSQQDRIKRQKNTRYKRYLKHYQEQPIEKLRQILAINGQNPKGLKGQIVRRCADGRLLGRIPPCKLCGKGRLKFNRDKGIYKCPGFIQENDFIKCEGLFKSQEIERGIWKQ